MARSVQPVDGGPCREHGCDLCQRCRQGTCCRRDRPDYQLPAEGEWDQPICGSLGTLLDDGERVQCHVCGNWFRSLGTHLLHRHDLTADEYRALFGLRWSQPLQAAETRDRLRERPRFDLQAAGHHGATPEQLTELAETLRRRPVRTGQRLQWQQHGRYAGTLHGRLVAVTCHVCGQTVELSASRANNRRTCGNPACAKEATVRHHRGRRNSPEARARMSAGRRGKSPPLTDAQRAGLARGAEVRRGRATPPDVRRRQSERRRAAIAAGDLVWRDGAWRRRESLASVVLTDCQLRISLAS